VSAPTPLEHPWRDRQGQVERNLGIPPIPNSDYRKEHTPLRVVCYRSLRRRDWSIAEVRGINGVGRVISHERRVTLADVRFVVKETARQRVIRNRCREGRACALGELVTKAPAGPRTAITYNPYRARVFITRKDGIPVYASSFVEFTESHGALAVLGDAWS
jgi:hypothetical protein